jgi:protein-disulfide isomerase
MFGLSLLGILTVTHLSIQQGRNFDRGCFGFSGLDAGQMAFDCSAVLSSGASTFLGLSNITWGLGFYLFVAVVTFALFQVRSFWRRWIHGVRAGGLTAGIVYSGYLVYVQVSTLDALCALCLVSAGLAAVLFGIQVALLSIDQSTATMTSRLFKRDLTVYVYLLAVAAVLVGADLTYFNALVPADEERARIQKEQYSGAACQLDQSTAPVENNGAPLVDFQDVTKGPSDAPVTVIEYFDPNCPHCKTFHETMKALVAEYEDQVRFVFKPFPLRGPSLPETQALYIANQEGKFFEMLEAQYARQSRSGITDRDLRAIAGEIGMNADVLLSRIDQNKYREKIVTQRKKAMQVGVESTPSVLVNGHFVESRSLECMKVFIKRAQEGKLGGASSSSS